MAADKPDMDQRLHERFPAALEAKVINLACGNSAGGQFTDVSSAGVCVTLSKEFARGDVVRVDFSDGSLFGQVVHVTPDGAMFRTGIEVFQVLLGTSDLSRLIERTLDRKAPRMAARA